MLEARVEGASAEALQQPKARAVIAAALFGAPTRGARGPAVGRIASADTPTPQPFAQRPRVSFTADRWAGGTLAHLPGRVPPSGWDGEPGAAAPVRPEA